VKKKHHLIFVPGLSDNNKLLTWAINRFNKDEFTPHIHLAPWLKRTEKFEPKLNRLLKLIDKLSGDGDLVSLIGISAGASLVLNAYLQRKNKIIGVVNICGRLRSGTGFPSLNLASRKNPAFKQSVLGFENIEPTLTTKDKKKVLTISAFLDEIVPLNTATLPGATNIQVPLVEHNLAIYGTLIFYRGIINNFLGI